METIWELDFYSRPVLDEKQKKQWEVLICEAPLKVDQAPEGLFQFAKFCPNTSVNSVWLKEAIEEAIAQAPKPPDRIRFFRRQMNNMITKACEEAGFPVAVSRRTVALSQWIQNRMTDVYPNLPNYKPSSNPSVNLGNSIPQRLPDALIGQQWAFVSLEARDFQDMSDWAIDFGEAFSLKMLDLPPDTRIPGLLIFSSRALPLAAWISGLELAFLKYDPPEASRLVLETGGNDAWIVANLTTPDLQAEAENFEQAKAAAQQVHFLGVQADPNSEAFTGFWLLQELTLA